MENSKEKYLQLVSFLEMLTDNYFIYDSWNEEITSKISIIIENKKDLKLIIDSGILNSKINKLINVDLEKVEQEDLIREINDIYDFLDNHQMLENLYYIPYISFTKWEVRTGKDGKAYIPNEADDPEFRKEEKNRQFEELHSKKKNEYIFNKKMLNSKIIYDKYNPILKVKEQVKIFSNYLLNYSSSYTTTMVGIFGKWGRGKTLFCEELFKELKKYDNLYFAKFQPWKYKEKESLWAYLYETLLDSYIDNNKYKVFNEHRKIFNLNLKRVGLFSLSYGLFILLFFIIFYLTSFQFKLDFFISILTSLGIPSILFIFKIYTLLIKSKNVTNILYNKYGKRKDYSEYLGFQNEIEKEIKILINTFITDNKKLVLFIDDLDRCDEEIIIDVMDSLRLVLEDDEINSKLIIICALDQEILLNSINYKYLTKDKDVINSNEYIQKFFLLGIKLPSLNSDDINYLVDLFSQELNKLNNFVEIKEESSDNKVPQKISFQFNKTKTPNLLKNNSTNVLDLTKYNVLNDSEISILKEVLIDKNISTPRTINILIQRYLLFKVLITIDFTYEKIQQFGEKLLILIVINSSSPNFIKYLLTEISKKDICLTSIKSNLKTTIDENKKFKISSQDLGILLKYSEMVNPF